MNPLISIITITFNAEKTLPLTLLSVKEQEYRGFEHIIIDGASHDRTVEIARETGDGKIRMVSEPDRGLYDAMNKGLRMARGKYVLFLNAGDRFSSPAELGAFAEAAEKGADIIYADTRLADIDGNIRGPRHLSAPQTLTRDSFLKGMLICHQAFMVRRELAPPYDLRYRFSADYEWCIRCIGNADPGKCRNLGRVAIDYLTDGLTDRNKIKALIERFSIMRRHYGLWRAIAANVSFIPRMLRRRFAKKASDTSVNNRAKSDLR